MKNCQYCFFFLSRIRLPTEERSSTVDATSRSFRHRREKGQQVDWFGDYRSGDNIHAGWIRDDKKCLGFHDLLPCPEPRQARETAARDWSKYRRWGKIRMYIWLFLHLISSRIFVVLKPFQSQLCGQFALYNYSTCQMRVSCFQKGPTQILMFWAQLIQRYHRQPWPRRSLPSLVWTWQGQKWPL